MDAEQILERLEDPPALEALYRSAPPAFRRALAEARQARPEDLVLRVWEARLAGVPGKGQDFRALFRAAAIALACGLLVRVPALWLEAEWYYPRFAPLWVLLGLSLIFWFERRDRRLLYAGLVLVLLVGGWASLLPGSSDSVLMALLHLPILGWAFLGFVFSGPTWREAEPRVRFLRYNGELLILCSLVGLGGMVFSGITVQLFELVSPGSEEWYFSNVGVMGAAAVPLVATYLHNTVFQRQTAIAAVLARVFAPLFLVMSGSYLAVACLAGQNPFVDRNSLLTVNGLLLVVLGMTVLSVVERRDGEAVGWGDRVHLALLVVTLGIDLLALSAIVFRLASYGFTPNRVVVLGANGVILAHLVLLCQTQFALVRGRADVEGSRRAVVGFLPVYLLWALVVVLVLPLLFHFS